MLCLILAAPLWCQKMNPPFQLPAGVEMKADLVYASPGGRDLHLDLFLPKTGAGPFPAVVYIHGGGFSKGETRWRSAGRPPTWRRRASWASIEYRLSGEAKYPAALYDSKAAVRWMRVHAKEYRIAPDKIGAAGGSAGGHLVGMLGTTGDMPAFEGQSGNPGVSSRVLGGGGIQSRRRSGEHREDESDGRQPGEIPRMHLYRESEAMGGSYAINARQ